MAEEEWRVIGIIRAGWSHLCAVVDVKPCLETLRQMAGTEQFVIEFK